MNREQWLNEMAKRLAPRLEEAGVTLPPFKVSIGFPSAGRKSKRIGECWDKSCSKDSCFEIFIHPGEDESTRVADILAHELVHAAVGLEEKHGGEFKRVALAIGLEGKMTATTASEPFKQFLQEIVDNDLGPIPHGKLDATASSAPPKQTTRLIKCECGLCGYTVRVSRKWIEDPGPPICPCSNQSMETD